MHHIIAILLLLVQAAAAGAQTIPLYVMEVPPLTMNEATRHGSVGDLVLEAMRRAGYTSGVLTVPNNRAMMMVEQADSRDALIIPLARFKEREPNYTWIAPLSRVDRAFFTIGRRVGSFAEARTRLRKVAVARGSAGLFLLREQGFTSEQIYETTEGESAAKMLLAGRIDAWYGPIMQLRFLLQKVDRDRKIHAGAPLGPTLNYLACSKQCNPALVAGLSRELEKMEQDGSARAIREKYKADAAPLTSRHRHGHQRRMRTQASRRADKQPPDAGPPQASAATGPAATDQPAPASGAIG